MRRQIPPDIARHPFDAIIIGAGINGVGIARDAALRGLRVLLLEKGDIASGTTSWSTRLIHGGLRYLEYGEVGLVRESLRERELLLRLAPHLVRPLPMVIPIYKEGTRGRLMIRAGMYAYELLSFDKSLAHHEMLTRDEALQSIPGLERKGLLGAARYYDAQVEFPERLTIENALAAHAHGACILTYARVERIEVEGGRVRGVEFSDLRGGGRYEARAAVVLNVAGPWVDEVVRRGPAAPTASLPPRLIGGTKGSHIIVEPFDGAPRDEALYTEARADQRPFFIIPWNNKFLIGTTDFAYEGDLDRVEADDAEIDYLITETNRVIPSANLTREAVLFTYAGVRPLPYLRAQGGYRSGSITRRHHIRDHAPEIENFFSIVGGKLTTYRSLAEQAVDLLFKKLGRPSPPCPTARLPLPGAVTTEDRARLVESLAARHDLANEIVTRLVRVYGARAAEVLQLCEIDSTLREVFDAATGAVGAEVPFAFQSELAETLSDCLLRRTMIGLEPGVGSEACVVAAEIARRHLGWDESRAAQEVAAYRAYIERFHPARAAHGGSSRADDHRGHDHTNQDFHLQGSAQENTTP